jgi:hypothetical protein
MRRARNKSGPRPAIRLPLDQFEIGDLAFCLSVDHGSVKAALSAASSRVIPLAEVSKLLDLDRIDQVGFGFGDRADRRTSQRYWA